MFEFPAELRAKAKRRLIHEYFAWFTTVGSDLTPQTRPVWFIWEAASRSLLLYSQPGAHKVKHVRLHPNVAVHFNSDATGDSEVLVLTGTAEIDREAPPANKMRAYMKKYRSGIGAIGMTPEQFAQEYSVPIRVTPTAARGW